MIEIKISSLADRHEGVCRDPEDAVSTYTVGKEGRVYHDAILTSRITVTVAEETLTRGEEDSSYESR